MSKPFLSVAVEDDLADAIARMRCEDVARLVVLDAGAPVGVIACSETVAAIAAVWLSHQQAHARDTFRAFAEVVWRRHGAQPASLTPRRIEA